MAIFNMLLYTHIFCGGLSLAIGLFMLVAKKGTAMHKSIGTIYFFTMLIASLVALPMSFIHPNYFLFVIGVFTSYMLLSGRNYIKKAVHPEVTRFDWALTFLMLLFGIAFIGLGALNLIQSNYFGIVLVVFGGISLLFIFQDITNFRKKSTLKNYWLTTHLQRMVGSYIASVTAFLVVNNNFLPGVTAWLLPTAVMVPLIVVWSRNYGIKTLKARV